MGGRAWREVVVEIALLPCLYTLGFQFVGGLRFIKPSLAFQF
jgi:hypothetical protein